MADIDLDAVEAEIASYWGASRATALTLVAEVRRLREEVEVNAGEAAIFKAERDAARRDAIENMRLYRLTDSTLGVARRELAGLRARVEALIETATSRRWQTFEGTAEGMVTESELRALRTAGPSEPVSTREVGE